jgi:hypothetical protein
MLAGPTQKLLSHAGLERRSSLTIFGLQPRLWLLLGLLFEFDFGSDPVEPEFEITTTEEPLLGPATGLVVTSTPDGRFVY